MIGSSSLSLLELFKKCRQDLHRLTMGQERESRVARHIPELQAQGRLASRVKREALFQRPAWMLVDKTLHSRVKEQQLISRHSPPAASRTIHSEPEQVPV